MDAIRRWWQRLIRPAPSASVLLVCAANLCRSPMAEQVVRAQAQRGGLALHVESAGTHAGARAEAPDARALAALRQRGYAPRAGARSRAVRPQDFERFDLLLAMDGEVLAAMLHLAPAGLAHKARRFLDYAPGLEGHDVPDPYWGDRQGFEQVLDLCEAAGAGLLKSMGAARNGDA
jgi:protein-tyrosine phosphatase